MTDDGASNGTNENTITETVNITILPFNDTPVLPASITLANATEDTAFTFTAADLLNDVTDPDIVYDANGNITSNPYNDVLAISNLSVTNGTITDLGSGNYSFTRNQDFNGTAVLNYLVKDGQGGSIANQVNLTVNAANDAPVATFSLAQYSTEGTTQLNGQLTATDIDLTRGEVNVNTLHPIINV